MTVLEKIKSLLEGDNISYEVVEHAPVHTSADAAKVRDTDLAQGAKALVMIGDKEPYLFVVPADQRADFRKIKAAVGIKDLRMASPDEVEDLTTLKVGSIPPVGKAIGLTSFFDTSFSEKENVVFNAGSLTTSIIMKASDLLALEQPQVEDIVA
ncbi:hypothetical protein HN803_01780 [candidate division WWE3 bacterium]|nr:hypothetical protein [candidate division WWE3 bacterium]MBT7349501.1 hypothetical protein [candidate division WWE3 bacterium]